MEPFLYPILFCVSVFLIIKSFLHRSNTSKLPPGPTGLPILGSLPKLGSSPHESLHNLAKIHGPIMTLRLGSITTVVISSPETAREVLQKHDQTFADRFVVDVVTAQPNIGSTLAWAPGDSKWRNRRRVCGTQLFNAQSLDALQHLRHYKVAQLIEHVRKHSESGTAVDIGQVAFATTLNLISSTLLSIDIVDPKFESAQEFKDVVWRIMEDAGKPNLSDYFPVLRRLDLQGIKRHIRKSYVRLHEIFDEVIEKRLEARNSSTSDARKGDFLDVLLDQCQEDGSDFDRQTIKPLILDLFIAGSDTSALTTEWAMAELLHQPDILQNAKKELMEVMGTKRAVTESDMERLPYLQAIVRETLRLHPAAPLFLPYRAKNEVEVCGYIIPDGTQVVVNGWAIGRDPKYWKEPLKFCPERFMNTNVDYRGRDFEFIPFGAGRRICPGLPLAVRMVHLMLASLIHSFDWKLPEELDMKEQFGVTLRKAVPLRAIPIMYH